MAEVKKGWDLDKYNNESKELVKDVNFFDIVIDELNKKVVDEIPTKKTILLNSCGIYVENSDKEKNNLIVEGPPAIGKSHITGKIIDIFPNNLVVWRTRISKTALTYWHHGDEKWTWDGKILYLEDISNDVLNCDVFKVMMSEGSKAEITVDGHKTMTLNIKGKPQVILTAAEANPNAQILSRLDSVELEGKENQFIGIRKFQAENAKRGKGLEYESVVVNCFNLLKRVKVIIPFADKLVDIFPNVVEMNRVFPRFLNLIKNSCALHQFQRKKDKNGYYLAEKKDLELASEVIKYMHQYQVIGLSRKQMKKYDLVKEWIDSDGWFTKEEMHSKNPIVSLVSWNNVINEMAEKGLLECRMDKRDLYNKQEQWRVKKERPIEIVIKDN